MGRLTEILKEELRKADSAPAVRTDATGKPVDLGATPKDGAPSIVRKGSLGDTGYSVIRLVKSLMAQDADVAPFEREISKELEAVGVGTLSDKRGVNIPLSPDWIVPVEGLEQRGERLARVLKDALPMPTVEQAEVQAFLKYIRKAMSPLDDTAGGSLIGLATSGAPIEFLRAATAISKFGARFVPMAQNGLVYPKQTGDPTFGWYTPGATITGSDVGTGQLLMTPKKAAGLVSLPNEFLRVPTPVAESLVREALFERAGLTLELAALEGQGGASPLGILFHPFSAAETPTADKVTLHIAGSVTANGDSLIPEDILKILALVEEANDAQGATGWLMRPLFFAKIANQRAGSGFAADDGKGPFLFPVTRGALGGAVQKEMSGVRVETSTMVNRTRNKGTDATLTYLLAGNWRRMLVALIGSVEVAVDQSVGFNADSTSLRGIVRGDVGLTHAQSFVLTDTLVAV